MQCTWRDFCFIKSQVLQRIQKLRAPLCDALSDVILTRYYSSKPLGLFFCQFQLSRHISSMPNSAFQPSSASAFAGLQ